MGAKKTVIRGRKPTRQKDNFLIFGKPLIEEDEIEEVVHSLKSGWIGTGPKVFQFEEMFRKYKNTKHAIALNSCTAAIHLSCLAAGIGENDEVITTTMTFCATVNAIIHSGATPVLVDCEKNSFNIDPQLIEEKITKRTKAILIVHFAGRPCNMDAIMDIVKRHNLILIEDCAHAIEAEYKGKKIGTFGGFGCFSFYATKNVVTGEGGMIITDNEEHANKIKILALHGMDHDAWKRFADEGYKHYLVTECGFKYNMMDLQAAIGIHQLGRIGSYWEKRKFIWQKYDEAFKDLPIETPKTPDTDTRHAFHLYTILIDDKKTGLSRDEFLIAMTAENIGIGVHYRSIPTHPYYQQTLGLSPEDYPNSYYIGERTVSLPLSPKLSNEDVEDVIKAVKKGLGVY